MSKKPLSRDAVKYIAMAAMTLNHIGEILLPPGSLIGEMMIDLGYFTAITMCWFLVEGMHRTRSRRRYALRLFIFALLSQLPFYLAFRPQNAIWHLNMLFNLFACCLLCMGLEYFHARWQQAAVTAAVLFFAGFCDWFILAPVFVLLFRRAGEDRRAQARAWAFSILAFGMLNLAGWNKTAGSLPAALLHSLGSISGPVLACLINRYLYNGQRAARGRQFSKWFFYCYYPAHLAVLAAVKAFLL